MPKPGRPPPKRPAPPSPKPPAPRRTGGWPSEPRPDTREHAKEVRAIAAGVSGLEPGAAPSVRPDALDRTELVAVRNWLTARPLEPGPPAAALIEYPRSWTTKRGRYCKFRAPGAGTYALLRARPTF